MVYCEFVMNTDKIENLVTAVCSVIRHASSGEHTNELIDLTMSKCRLLAETIGSNIPFKHFPLVCQWFNDLLLAMGLNASIKGQFHTIIPKKEINELTDNYTEATHVTFSIENFYKFDGYGYSYDCLKELKDLVCNLFNPDLSDCFSLRSSICTDGTVVTVPENCFILSKPHVQFLKRKAKN